MHRGSLDLLRGKFIFCDYVKSSSLCRAYDPATGATVTVTANRNLQAVAGFGHDAGNSTYIVSQTQGLFKIASATAAAGTIRLSLAQPIKSVLVQTTVAASASTCTKHS